MLLEAVVMKERRQEGMVVGCLFALPALLMSNAISLNASFLKTLVKCPALPSLGDTFNLERGRVDGVVFWSIGYKEKGIAQFGKSEFFFFVTLCFPFHFGRFRRKFIMF